jgi:alcohol dehydrogenase
LKTNLRDLGVERQRLSDLATQAAEQWTGKFNPREVRQAELLSLYERAF